MSSLLPQSGVAKAGLLSILAGVAYSIGAPIYATACHNAATGTILETVYFIPTFVFALAGVVGLIAGTIVLINNVNKSY